MLEHNVYNIPIYGKPVALEDAGVYYAINRKTGSINNVFHLVYDDEDWYLYQLKNTGKNGEMGWVILADNGDYPLQSCGVEEIKQHFDKPEYAEPKGAWQLMRNSRYGFGKFTPIHQDESIKFAFVLFSNEEKLATPKILVPLLIQKATDEVLLSLSKLDH